VEVSFAAEVGSESGGGGASKRCFQVSSGERWGC
jgi:hypothetical protein